MGQATTVMFGYMLWNAIRDIHKNDDERDLFGLIFIASFIVCYTFLPTDYVLVSSLLLYTVIAILYNMYRNRIGLGL